MFETHTIHTHTKNVFLPTSKSPDVHSEWTNLGHMPTSEPISVQENGLCDWLRPIKIHPDGWGGAESVFQEHKAQVVRGGIKIRYY